ncbi:MAG TPA: hypothetical protein VNJ04_04110 [Gemmatimonadaceae bacterium]|nr:hypothetical protein [Gemmatimonadaceae bacterium]
MPDDEDRECESRSEGAEPGFLADGQPIPTPSLAVTVFGARLTTPLGGRHTDEMHEIQTLKRIAAQ